MGDMFHRPEFAHQLFTFICDEVLVPHIEVHAAVAACHTYGRFPMPKNLDDIPFEIPEREKPSI